MNAHARAREAEMGSRVPLPRPVIMVDGAWSAARARERLAILIARTRAHARPGDWFRPSDLGVVWAR